MTFTFHYNVTGPDRKRLVQAIADIHGCPSRYLGAPTFAYQVDYFTIGRDGSVSFDDSADSKEIETLVERLAERGFTAEATEDAAQEPETGFCVQLPREGITDAALENLRRMVNSKASLIRKAIGADSLDIAADAERVSFLWFQTVPEPEVASAVTMFISRLTETAKGQKRVTAREREVDNEKYAFRCFLLRLGFIGAEYKEARKVLLRNLTGSSAFKSGSRKAAETADSPD